jgi:hypothetical protein
MRIAVEGSVASSPRRDHAVAAVDGPRRDVDTGPVDDLRVGRNLRDFSDRAVSPSTMSTLAFSEATLRVLVRSSRI